MDTNEKISLFREMVVEDADRTLEERVSSFEDSLIKVLNDHIREKTSKDNIIVETEKENVRKERNKQLSQMQLQMQRDLHKQQQQLEEEVFQQVKNQLTAFMQTKDYDVWLEEKIKAALEIANGEEIVIYVDPSDAEKIPALTEQTGHTITVSSRPFIGGVRGVIQSRNMLIDYSFLKRMEAERENFSFELTEEEDEI